MTTLRQSARSRASKYRALASSQPRWVEFAAAGLFFVVLAFLAYGWYAFHGGFVADDWVNAHRYYFHHGSGFWGAVDNYQTPSRPVAAVYVSLTYALLGTHLHYHLVLSVLLAGFLSTAFFAFLRTVGVGFALALAASILLMVFPSSDSTRFWSTASQINLFIGLYLVAAVIAIAGRRRFGPAPTVPAVLTQVLASALAVTAVAGYEIVAPAVLLSIVLYGWLDRRGAVWRWLFDAIPTVLVLIFFTQKFGGGGAQGMQLLTNVWTVAEGALSVQGYTFVPIRGGVSQWVVLGGVAAVLAAVWLVKRFAAATPDRDAIVHWLRPMLLSIGGIVIGYLMIVPAGERYPLYAPGVQNRSNCFAALGFSTLTVSVLAAIAAMVVAVVPRLSRKARVQLRWALTGLLVFGMFTVWALRVDEDRTRWTNSAVAQEQILAGAHELVPSPPENSTIFTSPYAGYSAPSVPIFGGGGNNDELGAFKVSYDRADLRAFPLLEGNGVTCGPRGVSVSDAGNSNTRYGKAILIDFRKGLIYRPQNQAECVKYTNAMLPFGPVNLTEEW